MIHAKASAVGRQLEALWTSGTLTGMSDAQLLDRFARVRDATAESAFRELMARHGPMVMGVCRQILGQVHDADDAFQATFLVLVRKAASIRVGESLAPWLYAVAYRTAQRARAVASRYRSAQVENLEDPMGNPASDAGHFDLRPLLHEELNRLPGKYREPIVLCHLEGKTHEEAARLLHWPVGTVSGRLSRGRDLLRSRLKRRGIEVAPVLLSSSWLAGTPASVTLSLIESTAAAAMGLAAPAISASVLSLTQGVLKAMLLSKIKMSALVVLFAGAMTAAAGIWGIHASHATTRSDQAEKPGPTTDSGKVTVPLQSADSVPKPAVKSLTPPPQGTRPPMHSFFPPVRLKNSPNIGPNRAMPGLRTASMVLVESPDRTAWEALSLEKERPMGGSIDAVQPGWVRFQLAPGTTARPILTSEFAALSVTGKKIDYIAAFNPHFGVWVSQRLLTPVEGQINPACVQGLALYQAGNDFYAFTTRRLGFVVLHLDAKEEATAWFGPGDIEVMQGNRLYVFSPKTSEWSKGVAVYVPRPSGSPKRVEPAGAQKPAR